MDAALITNTASQFRDALATLKLRPDEILSDGLIHRFDDLDDKPGKKSAWYVLHDDGDFAAGSFGSWKTGIFEKWCSKSVSTMQPEQRMRYNERIKQAKEQAGRELLVLQQESAAACSRIWNDAPDASSENPYLLRKGIKSYGLKEFKDSQTLIIPVLDEMQNITTLQFIDKDGSKKFKAGGRKKGCHCSIGGKPVTALLICEGYATGASLHEATGYPVAVAFDAGNLEAVGKALRAQLPEIELVFCADNDRFKEINSGVTSAKQAAQAVGGRLVIPVFKSDDGKPTDFNDLHQIEGLEAVKSQIDAAILIKPKKIDNSLPFGFSISNLGVYYTPEVAEDRPARPIKVCSEMRVIATTRNKKSEQWGRVVQFDDLDGVRHEVTIPAGRLSGDGADLRRDLADLGLIIGTGLAAKNRLLEYIQESNPKKRARCVQQTGWFNDVFVMPNQTIGESDESVVYQPESLAECQYSQRGELEDWRDNVASLCAGNSRLIFAVSASLAGMMLNHAAQESGGFHFVGSSSTGKSTAQLVAASVYGGPSFKQSWRATGNSLEGTCSLHNDAALILDEMAEVEPKEVGSIVYMIGNGTGKGRATRNGSTKPRKTWRIMVISSGEIGLAQHMQDGGKKAKAGQEVRMIDIAADAGTGYGIFEHLHNHEGGSKLSDAIKEATGAFYGVAAVAFLRKITNEPSTFKAQLKSAMAEFVSSNLPDDAGGQAERVCRRFALVAVAGEYATDAGITGWKQGDAVAAAATCFNAWLIGRGGGSNQESTAILSGVKAFFELHGESRFAEIDDKSDRAVINRVGFKTSVNGKHEFYVFTEAYKSEICTGYDMKTVTKVLIDAGWLAADNDGKTSQRKRLPEIGLTRCYVFTSAMWRD